MKRKKSYINEEASINLTPLIDVVFVILITFIVVAPLLEKECVDLADGSEKTVSAAEKSVLMIHVHADDTLYFNKHQVTLTQLQSLLAQAKHRYPTSFPQVFHDRKATFGTYQLVKQAVEGAGFEKMDILLQPQ